MMLAAGFVCVSINNAWADGCDNLDDNPEWTKGFGMLNAAYEAKAWDTAIEVAKPMQEICEQSPILNFTIAHVYKNKNDNEKYLFYLQKATEQTERFVVDRNLLDIMWAEKYLAAHPEAEPEVIKDKDEKLETISRTLIDKDYEIQALRKELETSHKQLDNDIQMYKSLMWTGTGIGIGGLAFVGTGIGMILLTDAIEFKENQSGPHHYKEKIVHSMGWAFVGVGTALTITGATLAAIYGYKYKHYGTNAEITASIMPTGATVLVAF